MAAPHLLQTLPLPPQLQQVACPQFLLPLPPQVGQVTSNRPSQRFGSCAGMLPTLLSQDMQSAKFLELSYYDFFQNLNASLSIFAKDDSFHIQLSNMFVVDLNSRRLEDYAQVAGAVSLDELRASAKTLRKTKIVEINATANGGGVAELLQAQMPLSRDMDINYRWWVLPPNDDFFAITKNLHNCLQGQCGLPFDGHISYYQKYLDRIAKKIPHDADLYVLHDPQTLGLAKYLKHKKLIWRCHIDLTEADPAALAWLEGFYPAFDKVIFSLEAYITGLTHDRVSIVHPAIDPLSEKNKPIDELRAKAIARGLGIDINRPYLLQVSRFDKFKDPLGVLELYAATKKLIPDLQCVFMGNYATDDPEGYPLYQALKRRARELDGEDIVIITEHNDVAVNALQRLASVVIQNSTKEGFGLTVTEAMWKGKIVFSHPVGGIALQVINNKTGFYLSGSRARDAKKIADVVKNPKKYQGMASAAKDHVAKNFLITTMMRDYLDVYSEVLAAKAVEASKI